MLASLFLSEFDEFLPQMKAYFMFVFVCLCSIKFLLWMTKSTMIIINNDFINTEFCLLCTDVNFGFCLPLVEYILRGLIHLWCDTSKKKKRKKNWKYQSLFTWKENGNTTEIFRLISAYVLFSKSFSSETLFVIQVEDWKIRELLPNLIYLSHIFRFLPFFFFILDCIVTHVHFVHRI